MNNDLLNMNDDFIEYEWGFIEYEWRLLNINGQIIEFCYIPATIQVKHYMKLTCSTDAATESSHTSAVVRVYSVGASSSILTQAWSTIVNI